MARVTPKMQLEMWDQLPDLYQNGQLAQNFLKLDTHDHSSGKGAQISTAGIANGSITRPLMGTWIQTVSGTTASMTSGANVTLVLTWPTSFVDTNYIVQLTPSLIGQGTPWPSITSWVVAHSATTVTVAVATASGAGITPTISALGIHN